MEGKRQAVVHLRIQTIRGRGGCLNNTEVCVFWLPELFERHTF